MTREEQIKKLDAMAKPRSEEAIKKTEERKKQRKDKDLLLKDLCARLPYGVKFKWCDNFHTDDYYTLISINEGQIIGRNVNQEECLFFRGEDIIKPYLRHMSSMTEEETKELGEVTLKGKMQGGFFAMLCPTHAPFDWLNAHHFDYRGLIEKGLAIEVTKEYYQRNECRTSN